MTEALRQQSLSSTRLLEVKALTDIRFSPEKKELQFRVRWRGFDESESSWEPAVNLLEDVPTLVRKFCRDAGKTHPMRREIDEFLKSNARQSRRSKRRRK